MKKLFTIIAVIIFFAINGFAQITITDNNGNPILNNNTFIINNDGDDANLITYITNNAANQIELKLKSVSITGADGSGMEFCIGQCYWGMTSGNIYPLGSTHFYLNAGATSGNNEIHFHHHIQTGDPDVTEYVLKIYEEGNEANNFIQFTYKYDANYVGINDINRNNIVSIFPNPASNFFKIIIPENIQYSKIIISNILGKTVSEIQTQKSEININAKNFSSGIYFVSILSNGTVIDTKKLILK